MHLNPVCDVPRPAYPEAPSWRRGLLRRLRRVTAVGAAVGGLWLGGCYGLTPVGPEPLPDADVTVDEPEGDASVDADQVDGASVDAEVSSDAEEIPPDSLPRPCEPDPRMSGMMAPVEYFTCEWEDPVQETPELPLYLGTGQLCAGGASVAWFVLGERSRIRVGLLDYNDLVVLSVMDSRGRVVAQIGPGEACVELDAEPDTVGLAAESLVSPAPDYGYFEFYVDVLDDGDSDPAP